MKRKFFLLGVAVLSALWFGACGDDSSSGAEGSQILVDNDFVVESMEDLLVCVAKREGSIAYVKDEKKAYVCSNGDWVADMISADSNEKSSSSVRKSNKDVSSSSKKKKSSAESSSVDATFSSSSVAKSSSSSTKSSSSALLSSISSVGTSSSSLGVVGCSSAKQSSSSIVAKSSSSSAKPSSSALSSSSSSVGTSSSSRGIESSSSAKQSSSSIVAETSSSSVTSSSSALSSSSSCVASSSSNKSSSSSVYSSNEGTVYDSVANTLTDGRDGQVYRTVTIGSQTWMAENLNYRYVGVKFYYYTYDYDIGARESDSTSWCYGDGDSTLNLTSAQIAVNCEKWGRLYTWSAVMDSAAQNKVNEGTKCGGYASNCRPNKPHRGICPEGWHVPTKDEFDILYDYVGGANVGIGKLKSKTGWYKDGNGSDSYGFSVLPAGFRSWPGSYSLEGHYACLWTASKYIEYRSSKAWYRRFVYNVNENYELNLKNNYNDVSYGFSLRCLKDAD